MKKPSLASVASMMEPIEDEESAMPDDGYETAAAELAEVLNVPEDRMGAFTDALEAFVRSCK